MVNIYGRTPEEIEASSPYSIHPSTISGPPVPPQQQAPTGNNYAEQARQAAQSRPGYYSPESLGDRTTQAMVQSGEDVGSALERQRQQALARGDSRAARFYANERDKYLQGGVEESSAYHAIGMAAGKPIPANPYENRGDVALVILKAGNPKDDFGRNYEFNPNVGLAAGLMPGGLGTQEREWNEARTGVHTPSDYLPAMRFFEAQRGRQGVYGNLAGGVPDRTMSAPAPTREPDISTLPRPFIGVLGPSPSKTFTPDAGYVGMGAVAAIPFLAPIARGIQWFMSPGETRETTVGTPYNEGTNVVFPTTVTTAPAPSGYQKAESGASKYLQGFLPEGTLGAMKAGSTVYGEMANQNPVYMGLAIGTAEVRDIAENPLRAGVSYGIGLAGGALWRGAEVAGARTLPAIAKTSPRAAAAAGFLGRNAPLILAGIYGADVAYRSTEGLTDFRPASVAQKAVPTVTNEGIPMAMGFGTGYRAPEILRGGAASVREFGSSLSQRMTRAPVAEPQGYPTWEGASYTPRPANWDSMTPRQKQTFANTQFREWLDIGGKRLYTRDFGNPRLPRRPSFDNEAGTYSWGGVAEERPYWELQPEKPYWEQDAPSPKPRKYAEPLNLNIRTEEEMFGFGGRRESLPAPRPEPKLIGTTLPTPRGASTPELLRYPLASPRTQTRVSPLPLVSTMILPSAAVSPVGETKRRVLPVGLTTPTGQTSTRRTVVPITGTTTRRTVVPVITPIVNPVQTPVTVPILTPTVPRVPKVPTQTIFFGFPSLPGAGSHQSAGFGGMYSFREHSGAWTPAEMIQGLFTGSYTTRVSPRRQARAPAFDMARMSGIRLKKGKR